jgi:hypothetical protein
MKAAIHYRLVRPIRGVKLAAHPGSSLPDPTETLVEIPSASLIGTEGPASHSGLVNVTWNGDAFSVFFDDLRENGEVVDLPKT